MTLAVVADLGSYFEEIPPTHVSAAIIARLLGADLDATGTEKPREDVLVNPTIEDMIGAGLVSQEAADTVLSKPANQG